MLFIEEIQSDWHNAGLEFGYEMTDVEEWQRYADLMKKKEEAENELDVSFLSGASRQNG